MSRLPAALRLAGLCALGGVAPGAAGCAIAGRYFLHAGFPPEESALYAGVLLVYLCALLLPSIVWAAAGTGGGARLFGAAAGGWAGVTTGLLTVSGFALALPVISAQLIAAAYCSLQLALAATAGAFFPTRGRAAGAAILFLCALYFFSSPYYTGSWAEPSGWEEWGARLAVWSAAPAVIGVGFPNFAFAYLPEIYRVWLGPVCPVPGSVFEAMLWYLLPAAALIGLSCLRRPETSRAEQPANQ